MKRREFSLSTASVVAASALTLPLATPAMAQARQFKEGKDYTRLAKPLTPDAPAGKVDVIEFFWYSCSHCNAFEPALESWIKAAPKDLSIRRIPVAFNASFVPQQKLYFTLEGMGKLDTVHGKVFRAIHVEKQKLAKDDEIFAWVAQQGVDIAKFKEMYSSFTGLRRGRRAVDGRCRPVLYRWHHGWQHADRAAGGGASGGRGTQGLIAQPAPEKPAPAGFFMGDGTGAWLQ